jgi:hypothetical protein
MILEGLQLGNAFSGLEQNIYKVSITMGLMFMESNAGRHKRFGYRNH